MSEEEDKGTMSGDLKERLNVTDTFLATTLLSAMFIFT